MNRVARMCAMLSALPVLMLSTSVASAQTAPVVERGTVSTTSPAAVVAPSATTPAVPTTRADTTVSPAPAGLASSAVALQMRPFASTENVPVPQSTSRSGATAMMVVGLAAIVTGIVVGDDAGTILVLAGAGVGLYGLYKFIQY